MHAKPRKILPWLAALASVALALLLVGCATPHERYRVMSYFLDGVPDPDAHKVVTADVSANAPAVVEVAVHSEHKPYMEKKCDACHRSAGGQIQDFALAYDACVKCHKTVSTDHKLMHGPVAREVCKYCHEPHEASQPYLLKDSPIKLCTQCHDAQLLGDKPAEHLDGKTNCLNCHFGHGGDARYFLKPVASTMPAAADADPAILDLPQAEPALHPAVAGRAGAPAHVSVSANPGKEQAP